MNTKYTFWQLINNYRIEIPQIQRDYVQGRKDSKILKIANDFLNDIKNSILTSTELSLDFVYGRVEESLFIPLDGQQRLTTLFLLHWYLALKEDKLEDDVKKILKNFTYETRLSTEDFCKNLVSENITYNVDSKKISSDITDSKWYFLSWKLDPTISSMLNMLDIIHDKFKDVDLLLFDKLTSGKEINLVFQFLSLDKFKLTDELYIKMNARGKPLTEFENFKAEFSKYLKTIDKKSKLDNEWLDIFWDLEKSKNNEISTDSVDEKFFIFFENITLNFYSEENNFDKEFFDNYNLFDIYKTVYSNEEYVVQIEKILDGLINFDDTENLFHDFLSSSLNYWQRLRFYALSQFLIKFGSIDGNNKCILDKWLRVTKNLINNTLIQSAINYKDAIRSLKELSNNIDNIYQFISLYSNNIKYFTNLQCEEESIKAKLILKSKEWEQKIIKIEQHSYFDGQIGFILQYSKRSDDFYDIKLFENYIMKLSKLFSKDVRENYDYLFQRALLIKGDYLPQVGSSDNYTLCVFEESLRTKLDNWRKVFNDKNKTLFLKELLDNVSEGNLIKDLNYLINNHNTTDWRKLIIDNPQFIDYCQYRLIRWYSKDQIYLLSKGQMNGRHRELYSWDLFIRKFENGQLEPYYGQCWYKESISWDKPSIVVDSLNYGENVFEINISYHKDQKFIINFFDINNVKIPEIVVQQLENLGFEDNQITLFEKELFAKINEVIFHLNILRKII